jgi:hypothetical protein
MRGRLLVSILAVALAGLGTPNVKAQSSSVETVVVTGSRMPEAESHLFITKRADHLITEVSVACDTRDPAQRKEELKATLRNMLRAAAQTDSISLGLGREVLGDLNEESFDDIISPDTRPDSSKAFVIVKTKLSAADTFNSATTRIKSFVEKTQKIGRTEVVLQNNNWNLTVVGPEQYRDRLISMIVADAKHTADLFGPSYGITIEGLERSVSWYQLGPLDMALYIPYTLHIAPLGAH